MGAPILFMELYPCIDFFYINCNFIIQFHNVLLYFTILDLWFVLYCLSFSSKLPGYLFLSLNVLCTCLSNKYTLFHLNFCKYIKENYVPDFWWPGCHIPVCTGCLLTIYTLFYLNFCKYIKDNYVPDFWWPGSHIPVCTGCLLTNYTLFYLNLCNYI